MKKSEIQRIILEMAGEQENLRPPKLQDLLPGKLRSMAATGARIFPDEEEVLVELCKEIDQATNVDSAWELVNDVGKSLVYMHPPELNMYIEAVAFNVLNSTVSYLSPRSGNVASGTLVEIDERIFVATTAHSVPSDPKGKLSFVGSKSEKIETSIPRILSFAKSDNIELCDVAFLEIEREYANDRIGKSPIPLSRISPRGVGYSKLWTSIAGFPADEVRDLENLEVKVITKQFTLECWGNKLLMPENWDVLSTDRRPPNKLFDVFIPRPRDEEFVALGPLRPSKSADLAEPYGMSGGGYWQGIAVTERRVWNPENYSLIAIQSTWWGRGRYLQGTQVIHWLRLLWSHLPELRQILESTFPKEDFAARIG